MIETPETPAWSNVCSKLLNVHWLRSGADAEEAFHEIEKAMFGKSPTNSELRDVVRWLAGPENQHKTGLTLREFIMGIFRYRKMMRQANEAPMDTNCHACYQGWASFFGGWQIEWGVKDYMLHTSMALPCLCAAGNRLMSTVKSYGQMTADQLQRFGEYRRRALDQFKARQKLALPDRAQLVTAPAPARPRVEDAESYVGREF